MDLILVEKVLSWIGDADGEERDGLKYGKGE